MREAEGKCVLTVVIIGPGIRQVVCADVHKHCTMPQGKMNADCNHHSALMQNSNSTHLPEHDISQVVCAVCHKH